MTTKEVNMTKEPKHPQTHSKNQTSLKTFLQNTNLTQKKFQIFQGFPHKTQALIQKNSPKAQKITQKFLKPHPKLSP